MKDRESDRSDGRIVRAVRAIDDEAAWPALAAAHSPCPVTLTSQQVNVLLLRVQRLCRPDRSLDYRADAFVFMTHGMLDACDARTRVMTEKALLWLARDLLLIDVHALNRALSEIDAGRAGVGRREMDRPAATRAVLRDHPVEHRP